MKFNVQTNVDNFLNDFCETVRSFSPVAEVDSLSGELLFVDCLREDSSIKVTIKLNGDIVSTVSRELPRNENVLIDNRHAKRFAKVTLYNFLSAHLGVTLPYGSLTGIRPTKLYYDLEQEGLNPIYELEHYYKVSPPKLELISKIIQTQKGIYGFTDEYNAFANIPVCPTRCAYCSFLADTIKHSKKYLPDYADNLVRDISTQFDMDLGSRRAIYVGGGTPTSIENDQFAKILNAFNAKGEEFTVEAGRPETLTKEKVAIMKNAGVTRVSVNPQTFKEETLKLIGRSHTLSDVYQAYNIAKNAGFDVNMDLIAMLPNESVEDFARSVDKAIELEPENITVHTLSIKRGSLLNLEGVKSKFGGEENEMVSYAYDALTKAGYQPYYMYRQKNTFGRLENVGYAKPNKSCVYNVDIMEETHSIHASGAGAISKIITRNPDNYEVRIERLSEIKEIKGYNEKIEELIDKKIKFFSK